jgi:molecular chaperone DnaJ
MSARDPYQVLGIAPDADLPAIKRAFHQVARIDHPDLAPDDPEAGERFRAAAEAYRLLSDPEQRRAYDERRLRPAAPPPRRSAAERAGAAFGAFVRGMKASRGADLKVRVPVSMRELARGAQRTVGLERDEACDACAGEGCPSCGHRGRRVQRRRIDLDIPPGAPDGTRLRVHGEGEPGVAGGPPGDLVVVVEQESDPLLRRHGSDVEVDVPIRVSDLVLGTELWVPTLEGRRRLQVAPGMDPAEPRRLPGLGFPDKEGRRGELVVRWRLEVTPQPTSEQQELMRQIRTLEERAPSQRRRRYEAEVSALPDVDD